MGTIMDIIYHTMPTIWKNKMIEQGFNYAVSTVKKKNDFFETRVDNLEPKEDKKQSSMYPIKKRTRKRNSKRGKRMTPAQVL